MIKIGIDLKPFFTGSQYRGIGMYSRSLIKELLKIENNIEYHYLNMYSKYKGDPELSNKCILHEYFTGPKIMDVGERQLFRESRFDELLEAQVKHFLEQSQINVMLFTSPNEYGSFYKAEWFEGIFTVGILYDLIPLVFPDQCLFEDTYRKDYERSIEFIKSIDLLLAISQSAKDDAIRLLGIPADKIAVISAGIDNDFRKLNKLDIFNLKEKYKISDSFFLFAGGIDFKKNIEGMIKAYSKLNNKIISRDQLVITGKASPDIIEQYIDLAKQLGVEDRVLCTGYVSKEDLIRLYNGTDLFIFPSLYEGFGLPVIEAMACGARVITSNCSSLYEIAKGHATLVNPRSISSIVKGIEYVINNPVPTMNLANESIEYTKSFTWQKVAHVAIETVLKQYVKNDNAYSCEFTITDDLLRNISVAYVKNGQIFTADSMKILSNELLQLANNLDKPLISGKSRILYDVTVVSGWLREGYNTGIGRVCKELFNALSFKANIIPVVVQSDSNGFLCTVISMENYELTSQIVDIRKGDIFFMPEFQLRGVQVSKNHPKVQLLRDLEVKCYAIVYDLLPLQFPEYFEKKTGEKFQNYIMELFNNYDGIISDSKTVSDDLIYYYQNNLKLLQQKEIKIGYFHLGQNSFNNYVENIRSSKIELFMQENRVVFLMVGTIEPRKGHDIVLDVLDKFWTAGSDYALCIIGHMGWNMEKFMEKLTGHKEFGTHILFIEGASDSEVTYAYKHATALIQASAGEGFGLPLIEAGHYELPILCSDIPVFHEVAEESALYFNRNKPESLEECINKFIQLKENDIVPNSGNIKSTTWGDAADKVYSMIGDDQKWYARIEGQEVFLLE